MARVIIFHRQHSKTKNKKTMSSNPDTPEPLYTLEIKLAKTLQHQRLSNEDSVTILSHNLSNDEVIKMRAEIAPGLLKQNENDVP